MPPAARPSGALPPASGSACRSASRSAGVGSAVGGRTSLQRLAIRRARPKDDAPDGAAEDAAKGAPWRIVRLDGPDPAQLLEGRTREEAARLAPRIFNLCGAAHGFAAARALGLPAAAEPQALASESVRDHALAVFHQWPTILGGTPDRAALGALSLPGREAATVIARAVRGEAGAEADFSARSPTALGAWLAAGETATARILARLRRADPAAGRAGLPELGTVDLVRALSGDAAPAVDPLPLRETGALGRVGATPLFTALLAAEGPSLFVRLLARLADLLALLRAPDFTLPDTPAGTGVAEAARGLLGHGAQVDGERVLRYRILSPSAWNLAPGGLLDRTFAALPPGEDAPMLARFLLSAINPCVPVTLDLEGALSHA